MTTSMKGRLTNFPMIPKCCHFRNTKKLTAYNDTSYKQEAYEHMQFLKDGCFEDVTQCYPDIYNMVYVKRNYLHFDYVKVYYSHALDETILYVDGKYAGYIEEYIDDKIAA